MKIGFLTSYRAQKKFERQYQAIAQHLAKLGHDVVHHLETSIEDLAPLSYAERDELFMKFYQELEECELIFADTSFQSTQVGFGLSYLRSKGKPVVFLYAKGASLDFFPSGDINSSMENVIAYEYADDDIARVLDDALFYMTEKVDKRFTIIFPASLLAKVEEMTKKRKLPKSVYIRQLIEEDLRKGNN